MVETSLDQPTEPTALMVAVAAKHEEITDYLLEHGGNPNAEMMKSWSDTTPLKIAIESKHAANIKLLINAGAIVTAEEVNLAIRCGVDLQIVELLLQYSIIAKISITLISFSNSER